MIWTFTAVDYVSSSFDFDENSKMETNKLFHWKLHIQLDSFIFKNVKNCYFGIEKSKQAPFKGKKITFK